MTNSVPYGDVKERLLADSEVRAAYDALDPAYQVACLRIAAGMTQADWPRRWAPANRTSRGSRRASTSRRWASCSGWPGRSVTGSTSGSSERMPQPPRPVRIRRPRAYRNRSWLRPAARVRDSSVSREAGAERPARGLPPPVGGRRWWCCATDGGQPGSRRQSWASVYFGVVTSRRLHQPEWLRQKGARAMVLKHLSVADILRLFPRGTKIPKPESSEARIKGIGSRRGQTAIVYTMPSHSDSSRPHVKGVTEGEIHASRLQLHATGEFSRSWFSEHLRACKQEGRCNFTTLGG